MHLKIERSPVHSKGQAGLSPLEKTRAPNPRVPPLHMQVSDGPLHSSLGSLGLRMCIPREKERSEEESQHSIVMKSITSGATLHGLNISFAIN